MNLSERIDNATSVEDLAEVETAINQAEVVAIRYSNSMKIELEYTQALVSRLKESLLHRLNVLTI